MWLTSKLISECVLNSNLSANYGDDENDQDNRKSHWENTNEGNYPASKYMLKVNNRKKGLCLYGYLWTYFTLCSSVFNVNFKHLIVH